VEKKSANAFDETLLRKIWESFELLVKSRLIQRVTFLDEMNTIVDVPTSDRFLLPPHLKVSHIIDAKTQPADSELEPPTKKFKSSDEVYITSIYSMVIYPINRLMNIYCGISTLLIADFATEISVF
jgi:hypothetical protein